MSIIIPNILEYKNQFENAGEVLDITINFLLNAYQYILFLLWPIFKCITHTCMIRYIQFKMCSLRYEIPFKKIRISDATLLTL